MASRIDLCRGLVAKFRDKRREGLNIRAGLEWRVKAVQEVCAMSRLDGGRNARKQPFVVEVVIRPVAASMEANVTT
jgi:hypothetical protein